jgi:hypothetical protein
VILSTVPKGCCPATKTDDSHDHHHHHNGGDDDENQSSSSSWSSLSNETSVIIVSRAIPPNECVHNCTVVVVGTSFSSFFLLGYSNNTHKAVVCHFV